MSHRTRIASLVVGALVALLAQFAWASSSQAAPQHKASAPTEDCISWAEFKAAGPSNTGSLNQTESFFGVSRGIVVGTQQHGAVMIRQYAWCGHAQSEGFFQVGYVRNKAGVYVAYAISHFDFTCTNPQLVACGHQPAARTL